MMPQEQWNGSSCRTIRFDRDGRVFGPALLPSSGGCRDSNGETGAVTRYRPMQLRVRTHLGLRMCS